MMDQTLSVLLKDNPKVIEQKKLLTLVEEDSNLITYPFGIS